MALEVAKLESENENSPIVSKDNDITVYNSDEIYIRKSWVVMVVFFSRVTVVSFNPKFETDVSEDCTGRVAGKARKPGTGGILGE